MLGIFGLYLPPDSYIYGQDAEYFFNEASVIWNDLSDCDLLIGAGDLNARTKDLLDYLPEIDGSLPTRFNPDIVKNSHGNNFVREINSLESDESFESSESNSLESIESFEWNK